MKAKKQHLVGYNISYFKPVRQQKEQQMSKANTAVKVLRVALNRVHKRWGKGSWSAKDKDGVWRVCLEGAITGGCSIAQTDAQREALKVIREIMAEKLDKQVDKDIIPHWNDTQAELDEVVEVIKLGIIRLETGYYDPEEDEFRDEETNELFF